MQLRKPSMKGNKVGIVLCRQLGEQVFLLELVGLGGERFIHAATGWQSWGSNSHLTGAWGWGVEESGRECIHPPGLQLLHCSQSSFTCTITTKLQSTIT